MNEIITSGFGLSYIVWWEALLRLVLALVFGFILGWERDAKNKPINFRAYMIVALTACVVSMLGEELASEFRNSEDVVNIDLGKVISGALTGIGFLGAGAIMKVDTGHVVGTATGASIWAAGGIGLVLGFGYYLLALMALGGVIITLILGGFFMKAQGDIDKETYNEE